MTNIAIIAGYGGHSGYAYAIAYYLDQKGVKPVIYVPRGHEWIKKKLERYGIIEELTLPRKPGEPLIRTIHRWTKNLYESLSKITRKYDAVLACGSNFSLLPALTAKLKKRKLYNLESIDRILDPSRTTRIIYKFADLTFLHWPEQKQNYPKGLVVGPVYEPPTVEPYDGGYILVTAGTLGNKELFDAVLETGLENIVLQTGNIDPNPYIERRPRWRVFRFTHEFDKLLAGARIVITQFPGMTGASAALAYRKPVILVPGRHVPMSSRLENAPLFAEKIGAIYVEKITPGSLLDAIDKARKLHPPEYQNGAERVASILIGEG
ncbi:MAG: polysaccharide biosynthesis protein [Desulfurococcales archaeon]|nr:polysaccharide biosynthesis protein [Desulfurococcales archaeon]MCE4627505.1 polysaccharide biosynthesis protein [Desulfurococcales archaeon]